MKVVAIVQARMDSTRYPNKVMRKICGTPMIGILLERLRRAKNIEQIILATSKNLSNNSLADFVNALGYVVYKGSEADVLDRYYNAAKDTNADVVVRVTGDCPLIDPALVDAVIEKFMNTNVDYVTNASPPTYPDGLDTEVFSFRALETAWGQAKTPGEREHVTSYIRESGLFKVISEKNNDAIKQYPPYLKEG